MQAWYLVLGISILSKFLTQVPIFEIQTLVMVNFMSTELGYGSQLCS